MKYQFNLKSVLNLTNFQEAKNTVGQDRHFLAMAMLKQAWHCSFGLPKMFKIIRIGKVVLKGGSKGAFLASKKGGVVQMLCKFVSKKVKCLIIKHLTTLKSRGDRIRTCDRLVPNQERYRAALHPERNMLLLPLYSKMKADFRW